LDFPLEKNEKFFGSGISSLVNPTPEWWDEAGLFDRNG
jgi:hypothetical protein